MSLRMKLTWALVAAALGPMLIAVLATLLPRAERRGLDNVEVLASEGTILATSRMDASAGRRSALADLTEASVEVRVLATGAGRGDEAIPEAGGAALVARRSVPFANEPLTL